MTFLVLILVHVVITVGCSEDFVWYMLSVLYTFEEFGRRAGMNECVCVCVCVRVYACVCVCVYIYIYNVFVIVRVRGIFIFRVITKSLINLT